jgi:hypothetical protein
MIRYVRFIRQSKSLGLTLKEIRSAIELFRKGQNPCPAVARQLQIRCTELEKQIRSLQELKSKMERLRRKWSKNPDNFCFWEAGSCPSSCDCPDSELTKGERHEETARSFTGAVRSGSRQGSHNGHRRGLLPSVLSGVQVKPIEAAGRVSAACVEKG